MSAAGTRFQRDAGLVGASPERFAQDVFCKDYQQSPPELTRALTGCSVALVEWLVDELQVELRLLTNLKYPGHSSPRSASAA